jgi:hypothetical protein
MEKINKLSGEQLALIRQVRDEWIKIGLDTAPVDRAKAREILDRMYALANKPAPKHIIHLDSPLQVSNAIANMPLEGDQVREQVIQKMRAELWRQVVGAYLRTQRPASSQDSNSSIGSLVSDPAFYQVYFEVAERVREQVREQAPGTTSWEPLCDFGQFNVIWSMWDLFCRLGIADVSKLAPIFDMAKVCGWSVLFWDWAFISAKPEYIHRDGQGRLHCETGPAVRYPDGFSVFAIHGVRVPEKVVASPETITVQEIESKKNAEVRRVMIERYGLERYLMDSGAEEIHRDDFGILYRKALPEDESLVMVKVVNSTPEPDGSFKDYFLRVPPTMERARQAVAWTFCKDENIYNPAFQT